MSPNIDEDQIREAFSKVKLDISLLNDEIKQIHKELGEIQTSILALLKANYKQDRQTNQQTDNQTDISTDNYKFKTETKNNKTENVPKIPSSTDILLFQGFKEPNINTSIGNRGVSTDRQTIRQTDRQTPNLRGKSPQSKNNIYNYKDTSTVDKSLQITLESSSSPSKLVSQLDSFKKDLRLKFIKLTNQEMLVFSAIYQFEDQGELVDYPLLADKLNLSESSIRDYIQRIISKGLPLDKEKINNKKILLHIPQDLRKLASLETLITLRNI